VTGPPRTAPGNAGQGVPGGTRQRMREMFTRMVEAKDAGRIDVYYDPDFLLVTNGEVQDLAAFRAGHERVYPTAIRYSVAYDDEAWVETADRLAGRVWITVTRPGEPPRPIEVVFVATFRAGRIHRLWELTHPDWSQLDAFAGY
jgi:hypothetical protein